MKAKRIKFSRIWRMNPKVFGRENRSLRLFSAMPGDSMHSVFVYVDLS